MQPLVTVIIPVFNRPEAVRNAVKSVTAQSLTDWELVVVDDCSAKQVLATDLGDVSPQAVRVVRHDVNGGAAAARNTGIGEAKGKYVSFLDSDDEWHPDKLKSQFELVESDPDPANVFCVTQTKVLGSSRIRIRPERAIRPGENWSEFLYVADGFAQTNSFFLSRELARRVLFAPEIKRQTDHLFFLRAGALGARYRLVEQPYNLWHHDNRSDRESMKPDLIHSRAFLAESRHLLTEKARLAFEVRYLGPLLFAENPGKATALFARAVKAGAVGPRALGGVLARCVLPPRAVDQLRRILRI